MSHDAKQPTDDDLEVPDPRLADAFAALPRELPIGPGEEERTVAALRELGMLPAGRAGPGGALAAAEGASRKRVLFLLPPLDARAWRRVTGVTVGLAASLAIFALGALWGQARTSQRTLEALLQRSQPDALTAATLVQRAGSAYVTSVADFAARRREAGDPAAVAQGMEAARAVLRAAAAQVAALDPNDPLAREILRAPPPTQPPAEQPVRDVVWF